MTYEEVVKEAQKIVAKGDASGIKEHLAVQYNITGEGEGAFYMEVKDGRIDVQPYDYKDRDILVTAEAKTILDMMSGKLDIVNAYLTHKITAEGDLGKANILKKLGVEGEYEGIGHCALGYAAEPAKAAAPRKENYVYCI